MKGGGSGGERNNALRPRKVVKVVLLKDVPGLGKMDTALDVAEGYARNYLIPRGGLAIPATSKELNRVNKLREAEKRKEVRLRRRPERMRAN